VRQNPPPTPGESLLETQATNRELALKPEKVIEVTVVSSAVSSCQGDAMTRPHDKTIKSNKALQLGTTFIAGILRDQSYRIF
jgi:hypothetical protein